MWGLMGFNGIFHGDLHEMYRELNGILLGTTHGDVQSSMDMGKFMRIRWDLVGKLAFHGISWGY
jgi:hypothetical protein